MGVNSVIRIKTYHLRSLLLSLIFFSALATAHGDHQQPGQVTYLGNEGLLIEGDGHKILFDPFFHNDYGTYQLVPVALRQKMLKGQSPYDNVSAVFISHAHEDHFDAKDVIAFLEANPQAKLVAPQQAIAQLDTLITDKVKSARLIALSLDFGDSPVSHTLGKIQFDVVRIPHAGWPGRADIENLVYRVRLAEGSVVMHMGDADPDVDHYLPYEQHWVSYFTDMAFPPYWFFYSMEGRDILGSYLNVGESIGVHVPVKVPDFLLKEGYPHFSKPGETRAINHKH